MIAAGVAVVVGSKGALFAALCDVRGRALDAAIAVARPAVVVGVTVATVVLRNAACLRLRGSRSVGRRGRQLRLRARASGAVAAATAGDREGGEGDHCRGGQPSDGFDGCHVTPRM